MTLDLARPKTLYLCDWLPPDFGAVGQCSLHFACERAAHGEKVILAGLSSTQGSIERRRADPGQLTILRLFRRGVDRGRFLRRAFWTLGTNLRLLWFVRRQLREADEIVFTGSPPFMLHFLVPLNFFLRKRLTYRITDFHPECYMATCRKVPLLLRWFHRLTVAWRRRVDRFEVLGDDQRRRLLEMGLPPERILLKRDPSPVRITPDVAPLDRPRQLKGYCILLYSGNFGVAHDQETFAEGYRRHHLQGSGRVGLWLNAVGAGADLVEKAIRRAELPIFRTRPGPLDQLARLLVTPDAHLVTLKDAFVGFVMPSKVYGCLESGRDLLYVGSAQSDVHLLCSARLPAAAYQRVEVGDADAVARALETIADRALPRHQSCPGWPGTESSKSPVKPARLPVFAGNSEDSVSGHPSLAIALQ